MTKRIIIKIGTKILTTPTNKLDLNNLRRLTQQIANLKHQNTECIIVSSGSITSGSEALNITPISIPEKQAAASIGQPLLLHEYHQFFTQNNIQIGQILLTKDVLTDDTKKLNVRNTITTLLNHNIIPIINENDSVATDEIQFGDNDILASSVAKILNADLLAILTDADGLYNKNPLTHPDATLIRHLNSVGDDLITNADDALDSNSKGGMKSKLIATQTALNHNIETVIANGRSSLTLSEIIIEKKSGTWFTPESKS